MIGGWVSSRDRIGPFITFIKYKADVECIFVIFVNMHLNTSKHCNVPMLRSQIELILKVRFSQWQRTRIEFGLFCYLPSGLLIGGLVSNRGGLEPVITFIMYKVGAGQLFYLCQYASEYVKAV